jgi:hypothetical protein
MKTEPTINIQDEVVKIHAQYGMTEMANYHIEKLFEKYVKQSNPKIKQLEWDFYGLYYDVKTAVGHYMILQGDEQYLENYPTCTLTHNGSLIADFNSIEEAKSAAQADFEQRVKECLIIE